MKYRLVNDFIICIKWYKNKSKLKLGIIIPAMNHRTKNEYIKETQCLDSMLYHLKTVRLLAPTNNTSQNNLLKKYG